MNENILALINNIKLLFEKEKYPNTPPAILYHYCNSSALLNIIKEKCVYLSDIRGMNDPSEMYYGKKLIDEKLRYNKKANLDNQQIELTINMPISEPFVFCLSAEQQLLSQWTSYADDGKGFALGFSTCVLENIGVGIKSHTHCNAIESKTVLSPVIYHIELQEKLVDLCLLLFEINGYSNLQDFQKLANQLYELPVHLYPPSPFKNKEGLIINGEEFKGSQRDSLLSNLLHLSKIFKNTAYASEKEYRIMKIPNYLTPNNVLILKKENEISFRSTSQRIIPYIRFELTDNRILSEIVWGPANTNERKHVELLLRRYYFPDAKFKKCSIPYKNNK